MVNQTENLPNNSVPSAEGESTKGAPATQKESSILEQKNGVANGVSTNSTADEEAHVNNEHGEASDSSNPISADRSNPGDVPLFNGVASNDSTLSNSNNCDVLTPLGETTGPANGTTKDGEEGEETSTMNNFLKGDDSSGEKLSRTNLYIRGLPDDMDDKKLYDMCKPFGNIVSTKAILHKNSLVCKGYGFVDFACEEEAHKAIAGLRNLHVSAQMARQQEQDLTNIYISNLPEDFDEKALEKVFGEYGDVVSTRILRDPTGKTKCVGFVRMQTGDMCQVAIDKVNMRQLPGYPSGPPILCKLADASRRGGKPSPGGGMGGARWPHSGYYDNSYYHQYSSAYHHPHSHHGHYNKSQNHSNNGSGSPMSNGEWSHLVPGAHYLANTSPHFNPYYQLLAQQAQLAGYLPQTPAANGAGANAATGGTSTNSANINNSHHLNFQNSGIYQHGNSSGAGAAGGMNLGQSHSSLLSNVPVSQAHRVLDQAFQYPSNHLTNLTASLNQLNLAAGGRMDLPGGAQNGHSSSMGHNMFGLGQMGGSGSGYSAAAAASSSLLEAQQFLNSSQGSNSFSAVEDQYKANGAGPASANASGNTAINSMYNVMNGSNGAGGLQYASGGGAGGQGSLGSAAYLSGAGGPGGFSMQQVMSGMDAGPQNHSSANSGRQNSINYPAH